ncbi:MAG: FAD-dependent monooxygenase [Drouetiella hepatica Uher 2000/2452]|jgi:2-polyprenyl-6-methoxyphenol hydroxylase-like FAD-dependent oxidoreductase|uniref:FAD-dependent monooxygenase n=1 Tax=Drouetiella hepatica Uher 2000/2452 TaxID=904376 RepID=A0A951UMZ8_9CYAN|nr:FAD-dependent monooxygenase [Drouetiella hepatica Uher 2000/2452]
MVHIVIAGAGGTGLTLAYLLARHGIEVTLIEAATRFDRVFRGEGLMPGGIQALEQMGLLELLQTLPTQQIHTWKFVVNDRPFLQANEPEDLGVYRPTLISQPLFLEALLKRAQAFPCFHFIQGTVQGLSHEGDRSDARVSGVVVRQAGQEVAIPADLVIGADGRKSAVRRLANLPLEKLDYDADVLWLRMAAPLPESDRHTFYGFIRDAESFGAYTAWDNSLKMAYVLSHEQPPRERVSKESALPQEQRQDWKAIDWADRIAKIAPPAFAHHIRANADTLDPPVLLNVMLAQCPQWHQPGVLLLGDAAHPMAPIRAQGINVALRDVIVAVNHLLPVLQTATEVSLEAIDAILPNIQSERQPEILRCQELQRQEQAHATQICRSPLLRQTLMLTSPLIRPFSGKVWMARQQQLRFGIQPVLLNSPLLN